MVLFVEPKKDARLNVRLPSEVLAVLQKIERRNKIPPHDLLRHLADEAAALFNETGDFIFPVHIVRGERPTKRIKAGAAA